VPLRGSETWLCGKQPDHALHEAQQTAPDVIQERHRVRAPGLAIAIRSCSILGSHRTDIGAARSVRLNHGLMALMRRLESAGYERRILARTPG
jgi:hypothetical protein